MGALATLLAGVRSLLEWVHPLRIFAMVIVVDGNATDSGLAYTTMNRVAERLDEDVGIILQFDVDEAHGIEPGEGLRQSYNDGDYPIPTLFLFPRVARLDADPAPDAMSEAWGIAYGEYLAIAGEAKGSVPAWLHELGHFLGLQHQEGTFMAPAAQDGPITPGQRQALRKRARRLAK